jgi:PAS domain S-box-containing protein
MDEIENLKKALERERKARKAAEQVIEEKSAELYHFNEELKNLNRNLEEEIARRTQEIKILALFPEEIPDPVLRISKSGKIVYANPASQKSLLPYFKLKIGDPPPALFQASIKKALATDKPLTQEYEINNAHYLIYFSGLRELGYINILARDISEIRTTQNQLGQSEKRYRQIIESASDIIYRTSPEGFFTYFNPTALHTLGLSEQEILSMHFSELIHPEHVQQVKEFYAHQFKNRIPTTYLEFPIKIKSGQTIWIGQNVQLCQENGRIQELTALARDITDRKEAEEALLLTSTRLSTLISNLHTGVILEDEDRHIVLVNKQFCSLFTIKESPAELERSDCQHSIRRIKKFAVEPELFEQNVKSILQKKQLLVAEEIKLVDGRILERDYIPIAAGDKFLGHLWQYRDVTEKRGSETRLLKSQTALLEAQELAKLGNWEYTLKTDALKWSEQMYVQYGLQLSDPLPAQNARAFIHPDDLDRTEQELQKSVSTGNNRYEQRIIQPGGEVRYLQITAKPEFSSTGALLCFYGTSLDITELRKAEEQLKESEERFNLAVQGTNDGIWDWNLLDNHVYMSPQWKQMLGYKEEELVSGYDTWFKLLHPEDRDDTLKALQGHKSNDATLLSYEYRMQHKNGSYRNIMTRGIMVKDGSGKVIRIVGSNSDITDRKATEKKIFKNLQQQKLISDISFLFSTVMEDLEGQVNQAVEILGKHTDVSRVYIFENSSDEVFTSNTFEWCNKGIRPQIESLQNVPYSMVPFFKKKLIKEGVICNDVQELSEELQELLEPQNIKAMMVFPILVKHRFAGFVGFDDCINTRKWDESDIQLLKTFTNLLGNVYERQQVELQVTLSEEKYRSVIDNLTEVIFQTNEKSILTFLNPAWTDITGYSMEESIGKNLLEYIYPLDRIEMDELYELLMDQRIDFCRQTLRLNNKNGEIRWIEVYARLTLDQFNQIEGISGTLNDVTDRKLADEALIKAKEQAEQASQAKAQFLSTMSHEIRTPMNAVIGITHLLLMNNPLPDQVKNLDLLKFSGENLLHLLNDILDFSKIEAGKVHFEEVDFSIKNLLSGIKHSLGIRAEEKGIQLNMLTDPELPAMLKGDPTRLSQVLNNLLGNAIKFTEKGHVSLSLDVLENNPDEILLEFTVSDTGIGIPAEKLQHIFDSFSQASTDTTRKYGGTGLGLAITKKLLELQGSQIQVESEAGKGSKFFFRLPFGPSMAKPAGNRYPQADLNTNQGLNAHRILLVEDNPVNTVVAAHFLESWGVEVEVAENGARACELVQAQTFALVLMDLQMPVMDGYQATKRIRETYDKKELPIIALTADAMQGVQEQIHAAGMNDYISKPFSPDELYKKILNHVKPSFTHEHQEKLKAEKVKAVTEEIIEVLQTPEEEVLAVENDYNLNPSGNDANPPYSLEKLLSQTGGNQEFMKRMTFLFIKTCPELLDGIMAGTKEKQIEQVQALAHKLKPSIDMYDIESEKTRVRLIEKMDPELFHSAEGERIIKEFVENIRKISEILKEDPLIA